ncbi:YqgQ family protein [Heyndrickxia acidiproducens]|uniref:YqgQ family protein n=1 Tax=Heyndrickxia acidiproducens TaxID=1121084 RepID=UPI0004771921|nr:YqgQ family protein [Heyndrickxia acidiproducens]
MRTLYDVQQLLKKFGIIVYIGNRMADLELMELELRGLYQSKLVETRDFEMALLIIRQEKRKEKEKRNRG